jgi:ankyrin repeat protein
MTAMLSVPNIRRWLVLGCGLWLAAGATAGEIHDAVLAHDVDRVRQLLLEKPDLVNARTERGDTPLYIAAFRGYVKQMIPLLLQYGADPAPAPNDRLETPLSIARELNLRQTAAMLLKAGAQDDQLSRAGEFRYLVLKRDLAGITRMAGDFPTVIHARNGYGQTALLLSVSGDKPDPATTQALLKLGADPNATNNFGGTPYSVAIEREHLAMAALFRQHGAKETPMTRTAPLRVAAKKGGQADADEFLRANPGSANAHDDLRRTALHLAAARGDLRMVELLLRHGADPNYADFADNTPLHHAASFGKPELVALLLANKADPNRRNRQRASPLLNAASVGAQPVVEALLKACADVTVMDNVGETALHRAAGGGHVELMKLLLERGLDLNARDRQRQTPLHQAAQRGLVDAVKFLLARNANRAFTDVNGLTALAAAEKNKHEEVVKLLRAAQ